MSPAVSRSTPCRPACPSCATSRPSWPPTPTPPAKSRTAVTRPGRRLAQGHRAAASLAGGLLSGHLSQVVWLVLNDGGRCARTDLVEAAPGGLGQDQGQGEPETGGAGGEQEGPRES